MKRTQDLCVCVIIAAYGATLGKTEECNADRSPCIWLNWLGVNGNSRVRFHDSTITLATRMQYETAARSVPTEASMSLSLEDADIVAFGIEASPWY